MQCVIIYSLIDYVATIADIRIRSSKDHDVNIHSTYFTYELSVVYIWQITNIIVQKQSRMIVGIRIPIANALVQLKNIQ